MRLLDLRLGSYVRGNWPHRKSVYGVINGLVPRGSDYLVTLETDGGIRRVSHRYLKLVSPPYFPDGVEIWCNRHLFSERYDWSLPPFSSVRPYRGYFQVLVSRMQYRLLLGIMAEWSGRKCVDQLIRLLAIDVYRAGSFNKSC